jgi:aspartyl-tRNA(Asn)/glutamyl-tRNA(Gln) amidotransferase subunit A
VSHPQDLSLRDQAAAVASGQIDAAELLRATLERIEQRNPSLNAIVARFPADSERMLAEAPGGPLHGVPVAVKDQFQLPMRGPRDGSPHEAAPPGDSGVFRRLRDAGAIVVGVTNMHLRGAGSTGVQSAYGPVGNPWNAEHVGGGSSGGSASAVGARMLAGTVGADGGGSIRLPAAYCGVVGIKPTFGAVPLDGYIHAFYDLGAAGPFARDSDDARLMTEVLTGRLLPPGAGARLRVGVPRYFWEDLDPEVERRCRDVLDATAWQTTDVDVAAQEHARIATALNLGVQILPEFPLDDLDEQDPVTRAYTKFSLLLPANALARAHRARSQMRRSLAEIFGRVDVLALPTVPAPAPPIADPTVQLPSGPHPPDRANLRQTGLGNLTGVPGVNVPAGLHSSGLPIGLQLMGPWDAEGRLLDAAKHIEQATSREFVDAVAPAYL